MKHTTAQATSTKANHRPASRSQRTCNRRKQLSHDSDRSTFQRWRPSRSDDSLERLDALAASLDIVSRRWRASAVVHGDLRLDNCLLRPGQDSDVVLIDWEVAGRGDPTWDVACVVQELLTLTGAGSPAGAAVTIGPALRAFIAGYTAAGASVPDELGAWVAARLLQRAVQVAAWNPDGTVPESRRLVGLALGMAGGDTDAALLAPP